MASEEKKVINYGAFESWATTIKGKNTNLLEDLHAIQEMINGLKGDWESDSAITIRTKITNMESRFQSYYDVVDNYVKFLNNAAEQFGAVEAGLDMRAQDFI